MNPAPMNPDTPFSDPAGTWNQRFSGAGYLFGTVLPTLLGVAGV